MTIHRPLSTYGPVPTTPTCRDGQGRRCAVPATTWIVCPDGNVISAMCDDHADAALSEWEARSEAIPELAGWTGARIEVRP